MVVEQGFDSLTSAGPADIPLRRCVQCGEAIDPVILQNRRLQDEPDLGRTEEELVDGESEPDRWRRS